MAAKLIKAEQAIYDQAAAGLTHIPDWLDHRLQVYARCFHAWGKVSPQLRQAAGDVGGLYKTSLTCSMLLKQMESAACSIERERNRQSAAKLATGIKQSMGEDPLAAMMADDEDGNVISIAAAK